MNKELITAHVILLQGDRKSPSCSGELYKGIVLNGFVYVTNTNSVANRQLLKIPVSSIEEERDYKSAYKVGFCGTLQIDSFDKLESFIEINPMIEASEVELIRIAVCEMS